MHKATSLTTLALVLALSAPAAADPTLGLGVTFTWGGGTRGDTGIGLRVFSDDKRGDFVGTLGVDYMLSAQRLRPSIGVAYLAPKSYVGMDVGYDFSSGGVDVGVGLGLANSRKKAAPAPGPVAVPVAPPPPAPVLVPVPALPPAPVPEPPRPEAQ